MRFFAIVSTHLSHIGYDPDSQTMQVRFPSGGKWYEYEGVPPIAFVRVMCEPSHGKAFHTFVKKPGYAFRQIDDPRPGAQSLAARTET